MIDIVAIPQSARKMPLLTEVPTNSARYPCRDMVDAVDLMLAKTLNTICSTLRRSQVPAEWLSNDDAHHEFADLGFASPAFAKLLDDILVHFWRGGQIKQAVAWPASSRLRISVRRFARFANRRLCRIPRAEVRLEANSSHFLGSIGPTSDMFLEVSAARPENSRSFIGVRAKPQSANWTQQPVARQIEPSPV